MITLRAAVVLVFAIVACRKPPMPRPAPPDVAPSNGSTTIASTPRPEPSGVAPPAPSPLVPLPVAGFEDAVVAFPRGASRKPVIVAAHAHGEAVERVCEIFRGIVGDRAIVLCTRGLTWSSGPTYASEGSLARELDAAVDALAARYPERVAEGPVVYAGFSMGANFAVPALVAEPARFPRVIMVEGGVTDWTRARINAFARGGGQRVLFACGRAERVPKAQRIAEAMRTAGLDAHVVFGRDDDGSAHGHDEGGAVATAIVSELDWLVAGDARWSPEVLTPR